MLALGLLLLGPQSACRRPERERPEHVVLILVDTLRADRVGAIGGDVLTPALDRLAARGAVFERAIAQCSWTAPSVVSLFTGRRVAGYRLSIPFAEGSSDEHIPTIARSFQQAGWGTAAFICNDIVHADKGFADGFDRFEQHEPYVGFVEPVHAWFASRAGQPTFTYIHLNEPHDPYRPHVRYDLPRDWQRRIVDPPRVSPERLAWFEAQRARFDLPPIAPDVRDIELETAGYADDVHFADERIGALLAPLEQSGALERTTVIVTSDHGEGLWTRPEFASAGRGTEQLEDRRALQREPPPPSLFNVLKVTHGNQVYPELVHVPLIAAGPGWPAGARFREVVENVDIFATLLELCNLPQPAGLQGASLLRLVEDRESWPALKPVAFSATRQQATVIDQAGWQLVEPTALGICLEGLGPELYDLNSDPAAQVDVAAEHPEVVARLAPLLAERARETIPLSTGGDEDPATLARLAALGYVGSIVDTGWQAYAEAPLAELFATLRDASEMACLERLYAAQALSRRKAELSVDAREEVLAILAAERTPSVRAELQALFD